MLYWGRTLRTLTELLLFGKGREGLVRLLHVAVFRLVLLARKRKRKRECVRERERDKKGERHRESQRKREIK